ncbi:MAG: hypothetical protein ACRCX8_12255 [Sarcina sp.]
MELISIDTLMDTVGVRGNATKYRFIPDGDFYELVDNPNRGTKRTYIKVKSEMKEEGLIEFFDNYKTYAKPNPSTKKLIDVFIKEKFHRYVPQINDAVDDYILILEKYKLESMYIRENLEGAGKVLQSDERIFKEITKLIEPNMNDNQIRYELDLMQKKIFAEIIIAEKKKKIAECIKESDSEVSNLMLKIFNRKII